jgi:hypothetical protein
MKKKKREEKNVRICFPFYKLYRLPVVLVLLALNKVGVGDDVPEGGSGDGLLDEAILGVLFISQNIFLLGGTSTLSGTLLLGWS